MLKRAESDGESSGAVTGDGGGVRLIARITAQLVLMALVLGVALLATWLLFKTRPEVPSRPVFPAVYTVETQTAIAGTHQPVFSLYGEIVAARSVDLRSLVSGEVDWVSPGVKAGGSVRQGEPLLRIDSFNYEGALREALANAAEARARIVEAEARIRLEEARLVRSREQLQLARTDLERIASLRSSGAATQKQVDDRTLVVSQREQVAEQGELTIETEKARLLQLEANLDRLEWRVEQARRDLANTELSAPFDGRIRSSQVETGKLVTANDIVVSMYQDADLEVRFVLSDERFGRLRQDGEGLAGRPVEVIWKVGDIENRYVGRMDRIGAEITSASGGVEVFATIATEGGQGMLRPGAFVSVEIPDRHFVDHFRLPDSVLHDGNTVYVEIDGRLSARNARPVAWDGEFVILAPGIEGGLQGGEEVLVTRITEIGEGLNVRREGDPLPRAAQSEASGNE